MWSAPLHPDWFRGRILVRRFTRGASRGTRCRSRCAPLARSQINRPFATQPRPVIRRSHGRSVNRTLSSPAPFAQVRVPPETKAKDVKCDVKANSIEVSVATLPADQREVLKGTLFQTVSTDDCSWTIANVDGGRVLQARPVAPPAADDVLSLRAPVVVFLCTN